MTTESTQPQPEQGAAPDNGQAQQQGHRRRRRRRKNKSSQGTVPAQAAQGPSQAQSQPPAQNQTQGQTQTQPRQQQRRQSRKKKFTQKHSSPQQQPGNSISAPPQSKRKGRQKGPRAFVGPMDHSYRAVNGNMVDGPPSTIPVAGNGSYYAEAYATPAAAPPRDDAPTRIYCFIEDLFFMAKIQETARKLGVKVEFAKGDKETVERIGGAPEGERPALLVFDLNNANAKPMTLIPKFKTKFKKSVSIIGFLSHLQGELKIKAMEVGCDTVMPRSAFSQSLPVLLRRYGTEEKEEFEPQPAF